MKLYVEMVGFDEYPYAYENALGYAFVDINNDGVLELLPGSIDGLNDSARLDKNADTLTQLTEICSDFSFSEENS